MPAHRGSLTLAFPLVATALAPDEADACPLPYTCEDVPSWSGVELRNAAKIPVDGVLVLAGRRHGEGDPLAAITLEVTLDGQPVAGALETTPHRDALIWRPAEPWQPGAHYYAQGAAENPGIFEYCGAEHEEFGGYFDIDSEPSGALAVPEFTGIETLQSTIELSLESLACCEGAEPPTLDPGYCYGYYVHFEDGACGPTKSNGYFALELAGSPAAEGPVAASIVYTVKHDGVVDETFLDPVADNDALTAPVCVTVEALDLGTGAKTVSAEQCFGAAFADQLGPQVLVPALDCPLEQCAVMGNTWDKTMCTPLGPDVPDTDTDTPTSSDTAASSDTTDNPTDPDEDGDKGCACDETTAPPAALLALPLLLAARRRRR